MTRMRSIQVAAATIAVAVIVAILVSREPALRHPPGTPSPVVADPTGPAATGASSKVGYTAIRSESGTPADLPPIELPFRLALDELQARAKAGDPSARCRLAAEHAYCDDIRSALASVDGSLERQQARIARMEGEARQPKVAARTAKYASEYSARLLERSAHCEGVPPLSRAEIVRQWRAAALSGSRPAMVQYAIGNAFALRDTLELLPELQRYRGEAESIARRAAGLGSVNALAALAAAYWPASGEAHRTSLLAQAVDQDPVEALALYLVLQAGLPDEEGPVYTRETRHVINDRVARLRDALPPADQASAAQRASELQSEWGALEVEQVNGELLLDGTFRGEFPRLLCDAALADKLM